MRHSFLALAIGLAIAPSASSADALPEVQQLDAAVEQQMRDKNLPGLVLGVWIAGRGEYVAAKGHANLATRQPRQRTDPFRVGSITKTAIATVALQLIDEGKLGKGDAISKWYPSFPRADEITVDDLLRMRSGIADSWDRAMLAKYYLDPLMKVTAGDMIELAARKANQFKPPDRETVYTNVNYLILEAIIERVAQAPTAALIETRIFEPLGMTASLYPAGDSLPGPLRGYGWNASRQAYDDKTILNPAPVGGAGAMISSLAGLRIYARALCTGALLDPKTHRARLQAAPVAGSPAFVRYGEGIALLGKFCGHDGTIMGFSSEMFYLPDKDAVIVVNVSRLDEDDVSMSTDLFLAVTRLLFPSDVAW